MFGPNISGRGTFINYNGDGGFVDGCFSKNGSVYNAAATGYTAQNGSIIEIHPEASSSLYGNASTVQPTSNRLMFCIKS